MRPDDGWISDIRGFAEEAIELLGSRTAEELIGDRVLQLALTRLLENIAETAKRVSVHARAELPEVPWLALVAMRERIASEFIDVEVLHETIRGGLPRLITQLK